MSEEQLNLFLEKVKGDVSLQRALKAAGDIDAIVTIAKEVGFIISAKEWKNGPSDISEAEYETLSGGAQSGPPCQSVFTECPSGC